MVSAQMRAAWVVMTLLGLVVIAFAVQTLLVPAARSEVAMDIFSRAPRTGLLHILGGTVALLTGPFQLDPAFHRRHRTLHRWMGRAYAAGILVGGLSGLALAPWSYGGMATHLGFGGLAIGWLLTTGAGVRAVLRGDTLAHRGWMIRSYALTLAAVMLRIYVPASLVAGARFEEAYQVISWACWVPNLVVAELWSVPRRGPTRERAMADQGGGRIP